MYVNNSCHSWQIQQYFLESAIKFFSDWEKKEIIGSGFSFSRQNTTVYRLGIKFSSTVPQETRIHL